MTLDKLRPYVSGFLDPFVKGFDRVGMTPDGVSVLAFGMAILAAGAFLLGGRADPIWYVAAAALVFLNGWLDIIDGALAREQNVASAGGDLLDHVLDRYADIVVIAGLAAGVEDYFLGFLAVTGVVMTSYLGTQAQAVGLDRVYGGLVGLSLIHISERAGKA
ncbi:CDP-alcohol phosphatidyltransferase, partial [Natronolimnohabitans innermongolicus JCM 12255]